MKNLNFKENDIKKPYLCKIYVLLWTALEEQTFQGNLQPVSEEAKRLF